MNHERIISFPFFIFSKLNISLSLFIRNIHIAQKNIPILNGNRVINGEISVDSSLIGIKYVHPHTRLDKNAKNAHESASFFVSPELRIRITDITHNVIIAIARLAKSIFQENSL
jgi:hypothetical protein